MSKQQSSFHLKDLRENPHVEQHNGILDQLDLPPSLIGFLQQNQRKIWTVVIIVAAVVIVTSLYDTYRTYSLNKAAKAYDAALLLEGEQRVAALNKVKDEYSSTPSGVWSQIQLAHIDQEAGKYKEALERLEGLNSELGEDDLLKPLALANLGALYEQNKELDKAVGAYEALQKKQGFEPLALSSLGRIYETMDKKDQAVATYQRYMSLTEKKEGDAGPAPQNSLARDMVQASLNRLLQ
ncbi:MAG: tetratricopeptide repeat protein [Candidatus Electrothrix aestuarii]|uniref:Ancillary SecYEG translocon subunit n=1 Tax=Candidatus Electrothrix aestuarii TaxID=3062594 RepID=A0AAU8LT31_9BACT|nr:tetratricopeptide repeat protein [Candidatus Electrothrix aestuarii]WPD21460.1 MAG: tetratricopeptide repeat protein [Candidatus Electrothrix sp. GW3-3]